MNLYLCNIYIYLIIYAVYCIIRAKRGGGMSDERRERFLRLAPSRTQKILDMLRLLGNCANTSNYSYRDDEIRKIFETIRAEVDEQEAKFIEDSRKKKRFKL